MTDQRSVFGSASCDSPRGGPKKPRRLTGPKASESTRPPATSVPHASTRLHGSSEPPCHLASSLEACSKLPGVTDIPGRDWQSLVGKKSSRGFDNETEVKDKGTPACHRCGKPALHSSSHSQAAGYAALRSAPHLYHAISQPFPTLIPSWSYLNIASHTALPLTACTRPGDPEPGTIEVRTVRIW